MTSDPRAADLVTGGPVAGGPGTTGGAVPSRAQVVIVGGGVTGCSIAYHLAHLGWTDVVLLEQHQLTAGTTWHAAGLITSAGMTDETALFFSRYSRDLYARLEQETGHSTGFRPVGHISLATTPRRQEALRREAAWMHGFGVEDTEISPRELADLWPLARTDDVLSAFYVADEGRADPVGVATSLAKGARQLGVRVVEGVAATGVQTRGRRVRPCSPARARSRPRSWSTRRACGPASSGPSPGSPSPSRPPSITTCSPTRCRGWTRTCRSSRTRTTTATTGPRATACWWASSSRSPPRGRWTGCPAGFRSGK